MDPDDYAFPQDSSPFVGQGCILYHLCYGVVLVSLPTFHVADQLPMVNQHYWRTIVQRVLASKL